MTRFTFRCAVSAAAMACLAWVPANSLGQETTGLLPPLPGFEIDGTIRHQDQSISVTDFSGTIGEIPLEGSIEADLSGPKPIVAGNLLVPRLDYQALQTTFDEFSGPEETPDRQGIIPETPLPADQLGMLELELNLDIPEIVNMPIPLNSLATRVRIENDRLALRPLEAGFSKGKITGELAVNGRQTEPSADIVVDLADIDIKPFFAGTHFEEQMSGTLRGAISLLGTGKALADVLGTANGEVWITMDEGTIGGLILEGAGVDVSEALALYIGGNVGVPINCGRIDLIVENGIVEITCMLIDTPDSVLMGGGSVDLGIEARAEDFSLINSASPILIEGTMSEPGVALGETDWLPFFEMGDAEPVDCAALLQSDIRREIQTDPENNPESDG